MYRQTFAKSAEEDKPSKMIQKIILYHVGNTTSEQDVYHAFFTAIMNRHVDVVKVFMEHGCDVHAEDDELIHLSFRAETLDIFKLLTKDGTDIVNDYVRSNLLCEAVCENLTDFVVFFLEKKDNGVFNFDINKAMVKAVKLLGSCYFACDTTIIKHLIDAGADDSDVPKDCLLYTSPSPRDS